MTKSKEYPDASEIITRSEIAKTSGISLDKLSRVVHTKALGFPKPVIKMAHCELGYNREEVIHWLSCHDVKTVPTPIKDREPSTNKERQTLSVSERRIDNTLAVAFLTGSLKKHPRKKAKHASECKKTVTVHLQERNDYSPPCGGLAQASAFETTYILHMPGNW
jgi:predicted DNA-binding transcriptional regulator AlpA